MLLFTHRVETAQGIDSIVSQMYESINRETGIKEAQEIVQTHSTGLSQLTGLIIDDRLAKAIGYQAREMITSNGETKKRKSGHLYASHPICVAAIANRLGREPGLSDKVIADAIELSLLHDVIEEGEEVFDFRQIIKHLSCNEIISMGVEFLDVPDLEYNATIPLPPEVKVYIPFAHSLKMIKNDALLLAELGDRFDGIYELEFVLREPAEKRTEKLIGTLAKWKYIVEAIASNSPTFALALSSYEKSEILAKMDPRVQELGDISLGVRKMKDSMLTVETELSAHLSKELIKYFSAKGIDLNSFYKDEEVR